MRRRTLALVPTSVLTALLAATPVLAKSVSLDSFESTLPFRMLGRPVGGSKPAKATAAYLAGSRIAAVDDGALVIDADSGQLIKTDKDGASVSALDIGKNAGLLTYDPVGKLAYVADRGGNRVAVVKVGDTLEVSASYKTPVEPYGIALSPDRQTVMVTTIADRTLVAFSVSDGKERWRTALGREPRNIAVSPDGKQAIVAYLATGAADRIGLVQTHEAEHIALSTSSTQRRGRPADAFARGSFTALFMGEQQALVPFQRETPVQESGGGERTGSYGGGFDSPIEQRLAFFATDGERSSQGIAQIGQQQARALAWDAEHDALYVASMGLDSVLQIRNASQSTISQGSVVSMSGVDRCGPDGLAIGRSGNVFVWCSFTRSVRRIDTLNSSRELANSLSASAVHGGLALVASSLNEKQHAGLVLFHTASPQISAGGTLACASCHPDGRADGLSWRIDKHELQTPVLAGRVLDTHPYKWDGGDADIGKSLAGTMKRLGGSGLDKTQTAQLSAYLEALPPPAVPTRDAKMVARGKTLFDSPELGCRSCHDGAKYTDNSKHDFKAATLPHADTPSLVGLAAGAPYYHDGSAATLETLLRDRARVHGMAETSNLSDAQVADLTAFLETL